MYETENKKQPKFIDKSRTLNASCLNTYLWGFFLKNYYPEKKKLFYITILDVQCTEILTRPFLSITTTSKQLMTTNKDSTINKNE